MGTAKKKIVYPKTVEWSYCAPPSHLLYLFSIRLGIIIIREQIYIQGFQSPSMNKYSSWKGWEEHILITNPFKYCFQDGGMQALVDMVWNSHQSS